MCGIFGYIGHKNTAPQIILDGLKGLEYRGYDSWGIAVKIGEKIAIERHTGKIGDGQITLPESSMGIGHTRWATHGGVTVENAHPHNDCSKQIAVLHNGIVENFQELKNDLISKGHIFLSQTDTEVIAHLIEDFLKKEELSLAVKDTFNMLSGLNAIVVMYTKSSQIVAAKNGSPLIIGIGKDELFLASDASEIVKYTRKVIFLEDHHMAVLDKQVHVYQLPNNSLITPQIHTLSWKFEEVTRGKYKHFMLKEMHEQPAIIRNIANTYSDQIVDLQTVINQAQGTFFIGSGTAYHACLSGVYLFSHIAKKHVNTAPASEFNYLEDFLHDKSLVIALSQSGETIDVVEPLTRAKKKGSKIFGLVNTLGSTIYRMSDYKMLLGAGPEKAVASTKAYIAKVSILLLLSFALQDKLSTGVKILLQAADETQRLLKEETIQNIKKIAKLLSTKEHLYLIGRGLSYPTALEAALKIKEVSYIHAEGLPGGELKHGSIALIDNQTPCIVFAPKDETYEAIISNATEIKSRGGIIIGVSAQHSPVFDYWIEVKDIPFASNITQVIPMQLLGYFLALEKGLDPDKPRNLAKSVTVK